MKFKKVVVMAMVLSLLSFSAPRRSEAVLLAALGAVTGGAAIACYAIGGIFILASIGGSEQRDDRGAAVVFLMGLALGKDGKANGFASPKAEDLVNEGYSKAGAEKISSELHELSARLEKEQKPFHLSGKSSAEIVQNLMNETGLSKESAEYLAAKIVGAQSAELEQESIATGTAEQGKQNQAIGQSSESAQQAQIAVSNAQ